MIRMASAIGAVGAMVVVFNIIPSDLEIPDFTLLNSNATQAVVTDVIAGDVDLVQVDLIKEDTDTGVVVDMTVTDQYVSISLNQSDAMPQLGEQYPFKNRLHGLD